MGATIFLIPIAVLIWIIASFVQKSQAFKGQIIVTTLLSLFGLPAALFIGAMATDSPGSTSADFIAGFFFIEGPLLFLFALSIIRFVVQKEKKG